jgi:diacylglycerol kinase (ATP)
MSDCIPILLNGCAGAVDAATCERQLVRLASQIDLRAQIVFTSSADDMRNTIKRLVAQGEPKLAVAGGDGTVGIAVQELANTNTALGILSEGTFNNFASTLRIPHNLPAALKVLRDGVIKEVDLGKIGDRYFTESAGVGLFADALTLYGQGSNKNMVRTLYAMARLLVTFRAHDVEIIVDGKHYGERVVLCEVANTYRIGQALPIAPEADVCDGELDLILIGNIKRRDLIRYIQAIRSQMHISLPEVTTLRGKNIEIMTKKPRAVHCDDHLAGKTPVTISIQPKALKVLVESQL